jgi:hypothetical protein
MKTPTLLAIALLGACATDPDVPPTPTATATGVVEIERSIDGATVYVDFNDNNLLDAGEPQARTDATGHFTLTWDNPELHTPHTIGAIASGASGYIVHLRAPIADAVVISPLTTLVVGEMSTKLSQQDAAAKITAALTASQLPLSQPLDVMADYTAADAPNSVSLRRVAAALAVMISTSVDSINAEQSLVDAQDARYFNTALVSLDAQLTAIATGIHNFTLMPADQQHDVQQNPSNYRGLFIDTNALINSIEDQLIAIGLELLADLFDFIKQELVSSLEEAVVGMIVDELLEIVF